MLTLQIEKELRLQSAKYWEDQLNRVGVPAGRVLSVAQALELPQIRHRTADPEGLRRAWAGE